MVTVFVLLKTTVSWLRLSRDKRKAIADKVLSDVLVNTDVTLRMFDAAAFTTRCTDVAMFQAKDMQSFYFTIERLRDSVLITEPYFELVEIIPTIEDGFRLFEEQANS